MNRDDESEVNDDDDDKDDKKDEEDEDEDKDEDEDVDENDHDTMAKADTQRHYKMIGSRCSRSLRDRIGILCRNFALGLNETALASPNCKISRFPFGVTNISNYDLF
ncbi:hypothetical protein HZH66_002258 [Vespula vulgaris]|uniref:Uncharacterized protein n=1 Tax=Vespula vulgaris TaxID=7454 RepID=A0A834KJ31_VESVU|nr:hypothetical protein HZH66_002258 [Vespula vulgaris]